MDLQSSSPLQGGNSITNKNSTLMKTIKTTAMMLVALFGIMTGCKKDESPTIQNGVINSAAGKSDGNELLIQPVAVKLGTAYQFAVLSKTGITNVYPSAITGNIGSSPITGAAIHLTCPEVTGKIFTVNAAGPLPCRITNASKLTTAVADMQTAYTDAAGRINPNYLNLGAGNIGGLTFTKGLYKWTTAVTIPTSITISGGPNAIFIFQVAGTLKMSSGVNVTLTGGAQAKNIYWQTSGAVTLGTNSHFEGNVLSKTGINLKTGASINGRLLAQTAVTLQMNTVVKPL